MSAQPWPVADASVLAPVAEREDLRKLLRDLVKSQATHEQVRRAADEPQGYSADRWRLLNDELDVGSLAVPEHRGGLGFGMAVVAVVLEETGRALLPEPILVSSVLGVRALLAAPVAGVCEELLSDVMHGRLVAVAATGPSVDSELTVSESGGSLTVSGRVGRVPFGATADLVVVPAGIAGDESLYLVDLRGDAHVSRTPLETLDLTRRLARLDLLEAPARLVSGPEDARTVTAELASLERLALAAEHVGMIDAMLEMTRTHLGEREQFGRSLASFQAIKHRLADILLDLERARSAALYAAAAFDQDPAAADLASAVAGAIGTEAVIRVAHETIQLHGGIGFTWEHPAHYYLRRALGDEAIFGSAAAHRALIADLLDL